MSLRPPEKVRKPQTTLHAKAKEAPSYRFYALYDKVYREDARAHAGAAFLRRRSRRTRELREIFGREWWEATEDRGFLVLDGDDHPGEERPAA